MIKKAIAVFYLFFVLLTVAALVYGGLHSTWDLAHAWFNLKTVGVAFEALLVVGALVFLILVTEFK